MTGKSRRASTFSSISDAMACTSARVRLNCETVKSCCMWVVFVVPVRGTMPRCFTKRKNTWAGVLLCFMLIWEMRGCWRREMLAVRNEMERQMRQSKQEGRKRKGMVRETKRVRIDMNNFLLCFFCSSTILCAALRSCICACSWVAMLLPFFRCVRDLIVHAKILSGPRLHRNSLVQVTW